VNEYPNILTLGEGKYKVYGNMVRTDAEYFATTYWVNISSYEEISEEYYNSRLVFMTILLDNCDEFLKGVSEKEKSVILSNIDDKITVWTNGIGGHLSRTHRDRYLFVFEERHLESFIKNKFSVLDDVRAETGANGIQATLCIGIGKDGDTPGENFRFASLGLEMALSRGGDQAVIRNR
jgi:c-di-AMP phosphodiesterase-like protein